MAPSNTVSTSISYGKGMRGGTNGESRPQTARRASQDHFRILRQQEHQLMGAQKPTCHHQPTATLRRPQSARAAMSEPAFASDTVSHGLAVEPGVPLRYESLALPSTADPSLRVRPSVSESYLQEPQTVPRSRRPTMVKEAAPSCPAPPRPLTDPMATVEGRWAKGIQERIDATLVQEVARKNLKSTASNPERDDGSGRKSNDPIVAAAVNGAILPFTVHPAVADPLKSVWQHKPFVMDPSNTSAGLTQDLINWSKFDNRYQESRPAHPQKSPSQDR